MSVLQFYIDAFESKSFCRYKKFDVSSNIKFEKISEKWYYPFWMTQRIEIEKKNILEHSRIRDMVKFVQKLHEI